MLLDFWMVIVTVTVRVYQRFFWDFTVEEKRLEFLSVEIVWKFLVFECNYFSHCTWAYTDQFCELRVIFRSYKDMRAFCYLWFLVTKLNFYWRKPKADKPKQSACYQDHHQNKTFLRKFNLIVYASVIILSSSMSECIIHSIFSSAESKGSFLDINMSHKFWIKLIRIGLIEVEIQIGFFEWLFI